MIKLLAIYGKSASGKDTLCTQLGLDKQYHRIVPYTTRPARGKEVEGRDYHFVTEEEFTQKVLRCEFLEATSFNSWFYGTALDDLLEDKINVGIFNLDSLDIIVKSNDIQVIPVYVKCADKVRLMRSLRREEHPDCHEICRRFLADEEDFVWAPIEGSIVVDSTVDGWTSKFKRMKLPFGQGK